MVSDKEAQKLAVYYAFASKLGIKPDEVDKMETQMVEAFMIIMAEQNDNMEREMKKYG